MDPMSDILGLLRPGIYGFRGLDAGGSWSLAFSPVEGLKCQAIQSGRCWIALDGAAPIALAGGDLILLCGRQGFRLYSDPVAASTDGFAFFSAVPPGETALFNGGGDVSGMGGYFSFKGLYADQLLGVLPALIHIRAGATNGALIWPIDRLMRELRAPQAGGELIARHLAQTLLIEALRLHLAERPADGTGWLYALGHPGLRAAMTAMHAEPAHNWTLRDLAMLAGMSRTRFATRFHDVVGETAMGYLTRWRMMIAADQLKGGRRSISLVARSVGYESESAFGAAFKRVIGQPPRSFANASPSQVPSGN